MSCIYTYLTDTYAYIATDSLNIYYNEKGERDKKGDKYIDKVVKVNNSLVGIYGQTSYNSYHCKDIHEILKKISYGYQGTVKRLELLANELKPQIASNQKLGFVILYKKNNKIKRHVIQVSQNTDLFGGDFSFEFMAAPGMFAGTFDSKTLDIDLGLTSSSSIKVKTA